MKFILTRPVRSTHTIATLLLILTLACSWLYVHWNEPATYYNLKYDPEFPYFMNSLAVFKGKPYGYMDHPGTPVELLGTFILTLTYPLTRISSVSFVMYHITNPGLFLSIARALIALMSMAGVYLLVKYSITLKSRTDEFISIAIAALFFAVHAPFTFTTLTY